MSNATQVTDEMVTAAWQAARAEGIESPYMARASDFPGDPDGLRAADIDAEVKNGAAMRRVIEAALRVRS